MDVSGCCQIPGAARVLTLQVPRAAADGRIRWQDPISRAAGDRFLAIAIRAAHQGAGTAQTQLRPLCLASYSAVSARS